MNPVLTSSVKMDYQTPPDFLDRVRQVGPIVLDPTTSPDNPVGATHWMALPRDGFAEDWRAYGGLVYSNPEYGRGLDKAAAKFAAEGCRGTELITLTPARTDTQWFRKMTTAGAMCFLKGRLTFWEIRHSNAPGASRNPHEGTRGPAMTWNKKRREWTVTPAAFPSLVCYWGPRPDRFREVFGPLGWIP